MPHGCTMLHTRQQWQPVKTQNRFGALAAVEEEKSNALEVAKDACGEQVKEDNGSNW